MLLDLAADAHALDVALTEQGRARIDAASGFWVIGPGTTQFSLSSWSPAKPFLLAAAGQGRANFVERLTRHYGCDVNYLDALHLAAYYGHRGEQSQRSKVSRSEKLLHRLDDTEWLAGLGGDHTPARGCKGRQNTVDHTPAQCTSCVGVCVCCVCLCCVCVCCVCVFWLRTFIYT
jgi:hypothetical protein